MNDRKLELLKKRADKKRQLANKQLELAQAIEAFNAKDFTIDIPKADPPVVNIETDTSTLELIAESTVKQLQGMERSLEQKPTIDTLLQVKSEISALNTVFQGIAKQVQQDIYARYDYANSSEENGIRYIGYLNKDSNWFIQRLGSGTEGESSTFATGKAGTYSQNWKNRVSLHYVLRDKATII